MRRRWIQNWLYAVECVAGWAPLRAASGPRLCRVSLEGFANCLEHRDRLVALGGFRAAQRDLRSGALVCLMPRHAVPRRVKSRASAMLERRPACASEDWVSQLPKLIDAVCEDWHLSLDDERMAAGAWGVVAWCHTESGLEAALKLCANEERLSAETNAMLAWVGRPAVRVLAHRPGALLLERARPGRPSRLAPARLALLLDALHRPTSAGWRGLGDWRASIKAAVSQVPSLQTLGRELLKQGQGRPVVALHGDLQPANILEHHGAIAVIDPVGISGPRELDVANAALRNNWGEEPAARIRRLAALTGTDPAFALALGQLSAMYAALAPRY
jgi:streptomycin 6-kinase